MLKIENLKKVFRTEEIETIALNGVSFEVKEGEFVAVMGPSGCGKSTLLNILGLLDNPTSGSYMLLDHEVGGFREKDRTKFRKGNIGFVFQSFNLIDELNVFENVELPLIYMRVKASERRRRVNEILSRMNISHRAEHFPQQLSGGQQQRVAIARAVVSNPKLILADEPTGNLDSKNTIRPMPTGCCTCLTANWSRTSPINSDPARNAKKFMPQAGRAGNASGPPFLSGLCLWIVFVRRFPAPGSPCRGSRGICSGHLHRAFASHMAVSVFRPVAAGLRMPFRDGFVLFRYFRVLILCAEFATFANPNDCAYEIDSSCFALVRAVLRLLCPTARYAFRDPFGRGAFRRGRGAQGQNFRVGQGAGRPACDFGVRTDGLRMER